MLYLVSTSIVRVKNLNRVNLIEKKNLSRYSTLNIIGDVLPNIALPIVIVTIGVLYVYYENITVGLFSFKMFSTLKIYKMKISLNPLSFKTNSGRAFAGFAPIIVGRMNGED